MTLSSLPRTPDLLRVATRVIWFEPAEVAIETNGQAEEAFEKVTRAFARDADVSFGRLFASDGLKVNNKIFAMLVRGSLVVKLPKARVDALVAARQGDRFDPGHGRLMKEW